MADSDPPDWSKQTAEPSSPTINLIEDDDNHSVPDAPIDLNPITADPSDPDPANTAPSTADQPMEEVMLVQVEGATNATGCTKCVQRKGYFITCKSVDGMHRGGT